MKTYSLAAQDRMCQLISDLKIIAFLRSLVEEFVLMPKCDFPEDIRSYAFCWLNDAEIGEINALSDVLDHPEQFS